MKEIGWYRELVEDFAPELASTLPSMRDSLSADPHPHKDVILRYLHSGSIGSMMVGSMLDVFTGKPAGVRDNERSDGTYVWGEGLAYYVDKYNLMLPQDFVDHILERAGVSI